MRTVLRAWGSVLAAGLVLSPAAQAANPFRASSLQADVKHYVRLGNHETGTSSEAATQHWLASRLQQDGLRVRSLPYTFFAFRPRHVALIAGGHRITAVAPYFYSGTTDARGRTATLVDVGLGTPQDLSGKHVAGRIAVIQVHYIKGYLENTFVAAFKAIRAAHAVGLLAITDGPDNLPVNRDINSRGGLHHLPTLFVGERSGAILTKAADEAKQARLTLNANPGPACDSVVYGTLSGKHRTHPIIVGTPSSAFVAAGSERGSGIAAWLALARHFATLRPSQRARPLVFAAYSGHELGNLGLPTLMAARPELFAGAESYVHLGASVGAANFQLGQDGTVTRLPGGDPSRALYVSENPALTKLAASAFAKAQPLASIEPSAADPGEQAYAYKAGIPMVSMSGAGAFFHTAGDTANAVDPNVLAATAKGFELTIDKLFAVSPQALGHANAHARQLGARTDPDSNNSLGPSVKKDIPVPGCHPTPPRPRGRKHTHHRASWTPVTQLLTHLVASHQVPGAGLEVKRGNRTVYDRTFGTWDPARRVPVASSTKVASATLIMTLVDQHKLSLSTRVVRVLPWFARGDRRKRLITLGELLSHTSGLRDNNQTPPCLNDGGITLELCVHQIAALPLEYRPGTGFGYGGADYQVAGLVAQTVAHQSFTSLFTKRIARPCHLDWRWNSQTNPRIAGGGLTNTASMLQVMAIQDDGGRCGGHRVLTPQALSAMHADLTAHKRIVYSPVNGPRTYGLGLWRDVVTGHDHAQVVSCPGLFGAYPWVDLKRGYRAYLSMLLPGGFPLANSAVARLRPLIDAAL